MVRKISGGKYISLRKKRLSDVAGKPRLTTLSAERRKSLNTLGGSSKSVLFFSDNAIVTDPKTGKTGKSKIKSVVKSPSNRYFKNVMVKGTIIETEAGKAVVTNRPGQEGNVSAVLLQE